MAKIGIFGGSFDPIHMGHLILAEAARSDKGLDSVIFVPANLPPHKPGRSLAPAQDRLKMVELALAGNDHFVASSIELSRRGPSYTLTTVRQLKQELGCESRLYLILGADSIHEITQWWHPEELLQEVEIIALKRPGYPLEHLAELEERFGSAQVRSISQSVVDAPLLDVSSTDIRSRIRSGKTVRYLVPEPVRLYILEHQLYIKQGHIPFPHVDTSA